MSDASEESPVPSLLDARKGRKEERMRLGGASRQSAGTGAALRALSGTGGAGSAGSIGGQTPPIRAVPTASLSTGPTGPAPRGESAPPLPARPLPPRPVGRPALVTGGAGASAAPAGASATQPAAPERPGPALSPAPSPAASPPRAPAGSPGAAPRPPAAPASPPASAPAAAVGPTARPAGIRGRHILLMLSFLLFVMAPLAVTGWYLWARAADQYASTVGFSVRREEGGTAMDILGGITAITGSSSSDTDILYEFLRSQELVARLDAELDLRAIWSKPQDDPVFALDPEGTIEDLVAYWNRMVQIGYDSNSGLIEIRALAFDPADATRITRALFDRSAEMINELSAVAREDAIAYARQELADSVERLKEARQALTAFRNRNQIVDPTLDLQSQAGLIGTLQGQLAEALIEVDLLRETTSASDPRIAQAERRVAVIEERIAEERRKLGLGTDTEGEAYAELIAEYESLAVEHDFAQRSYVAALAAYDAALAEARRKTRYLAAHILPTTAESARFPRRWMLFGLTGLFLFMAWSIGALVAYSLKDRR